MMNSRLRDDVVDGLKFLAENSTSLMRLLDQDPQMNACRFHVQDAVLPVVYFCLGQYIEAEAEREFPIGAFLHLVSADHLCLAWLTRFVVVHHQKLNEQWRTTLLTVVSRLPWRANIGRTGTGTRCLR
jgi:hypothetical protein